jgi:PAS domain S-box-containing protein
MPIEGEVMVVSHDHTLIALSVFISILAAYSARDLSERIRDSRGFVWLAWLLSGALANGISTWSMHYTAMLASRWPVPVEYDWPLVLLSLLPGIIGSGAALLLLSGSKLGWLQTAAASIFMGVVGISCMHYTAMASMRLPAIQYFSPTLVTVSVVLATTIYFVALSLTFLSREGTSIRSWRNHGSAVLRGLANPVMHFTAMAGTTFTYSALIPDLSHSTSISPIAFVGISIVPVMFFVVALMTSLVDRLQEEITERKNAIEKHALSERRLAEAQRVAHIGSWERDLLTGQVTWSNELYRLFNVEEDEIELSYERFLSFLVPQEVDRIRAVVDKAIRERGVLDVDYRIALPDGSVRVLHERGSVILNAAGEPIRLVGSAQDVTERRRVEEMLEENRRLLQMVLTTLPVGVIVTDPSGGIILANPASKRIWGDLIVSGRERWALSKGFWHDSGKRLDAESWASARALFEGRTGLNELIDIETFDGQQKTIQNSAAPIRNAEGLIVGAVVVNDDVTERVRAQKALRESTDNMQHLSRQLLKVQEEERRHLARELHDEFGQILATIALHLHAALGLAGDAALPQLTECARLLQQAGEQIRSLALELRPTMLDTVGLEATLRWLAEQHQQRTGCETQVIGHLFGTRLSPDLTTACYRVVQEALSNIVRHASARHVRIELSQNENVLELVVRDDGVGFDVVPTRAQAVKRGGFGLLGMEERIQLLGGTLQIESEPGSGTSIRASFQLSEDKKEEPGGAEQ